MFYILLVPAVIIAMAAAIAHLLHFSAYIGAGAGLVIYFLGRNRHPAAELIGRTGTRDLEEATWLVQAALEGTDHIRKDIPFYFEGDLVRHFYSRIAVPILRHHTPHQVPLMLHLQSLYENRLFDRTAMRSLRKRHGPGRFRKKAESLDLLISEVLEIHALIPNVAVHRDNFLLWASRLNMREDAAKAWDNRSDIAYFSDPD